MGAVRDPYWKRRMRRHRVEPRHPATGIPELLICRRCRSVSVAGLTATWTYREGVGWLCPFCASHRTWRERIKAYLKGQPF